MTIYSDHDNVINEYVIALNEKSEQGRMGTVDRKFHIKNGRTYAKVVCTDCHSPVGGGSAYCFIDRNTGYVYKPASWKSPAKGPRYAIRTEEDARKLAELSDGVGKFLYLR